MATIRILSKAYEGVKNYPLFFFNSRDEYDYYDHETHSYWVPEAVYFDKDNYAYNKIPKGAIKSNSSDTLLAFGRPSNEQDISSTLIEIELEPFDSTKPEHVKAVFLLYLNKAYNSADKYSFRELLWYLDAYSIDMRVMEDVISQFDSTSIQPFFWGTLKNISMCLSVKKQNLIKRYLASKGVEYKVYSPDSLQEAVIRCFPSFDINRCNLNIFQLIDLVVARDRYNDTECEFDYRRDDPKSNFFLKLRCWLRDGKYDLEEYDKLGRFIRLFSYQVQIKIVKRYFHAIRCNQTQFSLDLIKSFKNNQFENWGTYFHCVTEPSNPIRLAVPLLCDNIITFLDSGEQALQTINGTMDMAYARCDTNSPEVDFGLKYFMPLCNGGAIPNVANFPGFICYEIVYGLNESSITSEEIIAKLPKYLSFFGSQQQESFCIDPKNTFENCSLKSEKNIACGRCANYKSNRLPIWTLNLKGQDLELKREILRLFLPDSLCKDEAIVSLNSLTIDAEGVKRKLLSFVNSKFEKRDAHLSYSLDGDVISLSNGWVVSKNSEAYISMIISDFLSPLWIKVEPRHNSYIGGHVLDDKTGATLEMYQLERFKGGFPVNIQKLEHDYILPHIVKALQDILKVKPTEDNTFYAVYSETILRKIRSDFFSFKSVDNSKDFSEKNPGFITGTHSKYDRYCSPKFENDFYSILQLPYFWCRGKECFRNSLTHQTLAQNWKWEEYTLLHILEILGYPQIIKTEGGNEPSELIRSFIGMVNKAASLFKRVKCRECNHIIFPLGNTQFNRYNNFECRVPTCGERFKRIYLSQCHHCKVGLIDSRDSAQCPNGWHICPRCLSCCDDAIYERMASKYIIKRIPVPQRIQEKLHHGHNDKGEFFCPKCGGEVHLVTDPHSEKQSRICQECHTVFPDTIDNR